MILKLKDYCKIYPIGLDWIGLDWIGLDWIGFMLALKTFIIIVKLYIKDEKSQLKIRVYY